jgi:dihydrofolate reductase
MRHFQRATTGHAVIMGRRTWDSLPARFRPLPERRNIVVTRNPRWFAEGALAAASLEQALSLVAGDARVFVIGGAELYAAALGIADELLLTEIDRDFDGDVRFPAFDRADFVEAARDVQHAAAPNDFDFAFVRYLRRR